MQSRICLVSILVGAAILGSSACGAIAPLPATPTLTSAPPATLPPTPSATPLPSATADPAATLYVLSRNGIVTRISPTGDKQIILQGISGYAGLQAVGGKLYVTNAARSEILVNNLNGKPLGAVPLPSGLFYLSFTVLPAGRFALLDNGLDKIHIIDSAGKLLATVDLLPQPDDQLQYLDGIVMGNRLLVSDDSAMQLFAIDLQTYQKTTFAKSAMLPSSMLGAMAQADHKLYVANSLTIYEVPENGRAKGVTALPWTGGGITGMTVVGSSIYACTNVGGAVYRVNLVDRSVTLVASDLYAPWGLESDQ